MRARWGWMALGAVAGMVLATGCRSQTTAEATPSPGWWDAGAARIVTWRADDVAFAQNRALEASGLALSDGVLWVASEKYRSLLRIEPTRAFEARVVPVDVPPLSELEGVAVTGETAYLCDEAHAAVYAVDLGGWADRDTRLPALALPLEGVTVAGGKIGFEGIEVAPDGDIFLLLERSHEADGGCVSTIFRLRREGERLVSRGTPITIPLEDCAWRLSGLAWWRGRLLALKTQFPGSRYEVIAIDPAGGRSRVVMEMTDLLRSLPARGWANNVEGIAVTGDGSLYLVADNAVTVEAAGPEPPPSEEKSLLLRLPRRREAVEKGP